MTSALALKTTRTATPRLMISLRDLAYLLHRDAHPTMASYGGARCRARIHSCDTPYFAAMSRTSFAALCCSLATWRMARSVTVDWVGDRAIRQAGAAAGREG